VEVLPGMELPAFLGGPGCERDVTCPPGTYHMTQWRPLDPPRIGYPPCGTCADACPAPTTGREFPAGPLEFDVPAPSVAPEEIPLPPATPIEQVPADDSPDPLGLPDVSDQSLPGSGALTRNPFVRPSEIAQTNAQFPVESEQDSGDSGQPKASKLRSDVDLVDLIPAAEVEPWSGRIVNDSEMRP